MLAFLTHLAVDKRLAAATQAQALAAIVFLYRHVIDRPLSGLGDVPRARAPVRLPVVLTESEARRVLGATMLPAVVVDPLRDHLSVVRRVGVLLTFAILVAAGLLFRHCPEVHKRLMVFALVPLGMESLLHLSGHLVGRVPASQGVLQAFLLTASLLLVAVLPIYDKVSRGRIHPASIWISVLFVAWIVLSNAVIFQSWEPAFKLASWILGR